MKFIFIGLIMLYASSNLHNTSSVEAIHLSNQNQLLSANFLKNNVAINQQQSQQLQGMVQQKQKAEVKSSTKTETQASSTSKSTTQAQTKTQSTTKSTATTESKAKVETSAKVEAKTEAKTEAQANIYTELESLSDDQMMVDNEAMVGFSQAIQSGINVMDLPDPNQKKDEVPQLNDANTMFVFQEHVNQITNVQDEPPPVLEEEVKTQPVQPVSITSIAAQMAADQAEGKEVEQSQSSDDSPPPSMAQMQAQSALDDVQVVLPEGMDVQDHSHPEASQQQEEDPDQLIKQMQEANEANHFKDPRKAIPLNQIQSEAQAAMEYVAVKDPFAPDTKEEKHPRLLHIFESNLPQSSSNAVSDDVNVYQSIAGPMALRASKLDGITDDKPTDSILDQHQHEQDMAKQIKADEIAQQKSIEYQEQQEMEIAGGNDLWGSQFEMEHITGKLTHPGDFKSQAQKDKEAKDKEKEERQKIRMEILQPSMISDDDARLFSDSLATKSSYSKSENQQQEENQRNQERKKKQDEQDRIKLAEIQAQNKRLQSQMQAQEQAQIKTAELKRIDQKNNDDLKSLQELKSLAQLQRAGSGPGISQLNSLADQAAIDESTRQDDAQTQQAADAINQVVTQEYDQQQNIIPLKQLPKPAPAPKISNLPKTKLAINANSKIKLPSRKRH